MTETKLTGTLPNMVMEITHRAEPDGSAEHMTIHLTATPGFDAVLPMLTQMPMLMNGWSQFWLAPWLGMARANPLLAPAIARILGSDKN
jgi:hypothetical protein